MTREEVYLSEGCFVAEWLASTTERYVILECTGAGDLVFLAICTPRFAYDAYEELEC